MAIITAHGSLDAFSSVVRAHRNTITFFAICENIHFETEPISVCDVDYNYLSPPPRFPPFLTSLTHERSHAGSHS